MFLRCSYLFGNLSLDVLINKVLTQKNQCRLGGWKNERTGKFSPGYSNPRPSSFGSATPLCFGSLRDGIAAGYY